MIDRDKLVSDYKKLLDVCNEKDEIIKQKRRRNRKYNRR